MGAQHLPTQEEFTNGLCSFPLNLYACGGCGHFQLVTEPVVYWKEVITAAGLSQQMREFRTQQIGDWMVRHALAGKEVVEIGSGAGYLLDILTAAGAHATGLEYGIEQIEAGLSAGRNMRQGYILDSDFCFDKPFDGFICINFLEHSPEPVRFLRAIRKCCRPGAIGIVEVPNFQKDIDEEKSYNLIRDHLSYFTSRTLVLAVHLAGFELLSLRECWHGDDLEAEVRVPILSPVARWSEGTPMVKALGRLFTEERCRIAIWGASHQALTLLAMTRPQNVCCIADSAPFKQGRVDPACGIPIVSPEEMIAANPDIVIIMAAGFSLEVKHILMTTPGFSGRALILDDLLRDNR